MNVSKPKTHQNALRQSLTLYIFFRQPINVKAADATEINMKIPQKTMRKTVIKLKTVSIYFNFKEIINNKQKINKFY